MISRHWIASAAVLAGAGFVIRSPWLLALACVVAVTGLAARWWSSVALRRVEVERTLSDRAVFQDEPITLDIAVRNRKLAPVGWLRFQEYVPSELVHGAHHVSSSGRPGASVVTHVTSLLPYETVRYRHTLVGRRGHYRVGPARLESGDLFGVYETSRDLEESAPLVVYPRLGEVDALSLPAGRPLIGSPAKRAVVRDPLRPVGVREYRSGDARKQIHWKATARTGALAAKVLEEVAESTLVLVLNAATFEQVWIGVKRDEQDAAVEMTAGLADRALAAGLSVGLAVNGAIPGSGRPIRVAPRRGRDQLRRLLEALAAVSTFVTMPPEKLVALESRRASWGATLAVVTPIVTDALLAQLARVRRSGRPVALVALTSEPAGPTGGVPVFYLHRRAAP
jgi:uncharacterized protein (DUF58 family)